MQGSVSDAPRGGAHLAAEPQDRIAVDVSMYAHSALMFGDVRMDAEAFGVCVSRRTDATVENLSFDERAHLLDVLTHARRCQLDAIELDQSFCVWLVSCDARDRQPRNAWLTLSRRRDGVFLIGLSDL